MASEIKLTAVLEAKDNASKVMAGFKNQLDEATGASKTFALGLAAFGAAAVAAGAYAVSAARETVATHKQLNAVLESTKGIAGVTAESADRLAQSLMKVTNFDDEAVLSAENLLLTFTNIGKDIFPAATEAVLNMSVALGQDTKNSAIQLGKALQDPVLGVTALRRVGVMLTDQQQELVKGFMETGQTAKAQAIIMDEIQREFGGSARALASPITQMQNALKEVAEAVGLELMPMVAAAAIVVRDFAVNVLPVWIEKTKEAINFLKEHKEILYIVAGAIIGALVPAVYAAVVAFASAAIALAPFMIAGAVIAGVVAGILWVIKNWDLIKQKTTEVFGGMANYLKQIWENIKNIFNDSINWIMGKLQPFFNAIDKVKGIAGSVSGGISGAFGAVKGVLGFANGGIVPGPIGSPMPAVVHGGEMIIPPGKTAGNVFNFNFAGAFIGDRERFIAEIKSSINRDSELKSFAGL